MVKNVLTYTMTNKEGDIKIHPLAGDKQTREELARFAYGVRNLQKHGICAPFARVLGLPGVTQGGHGPFLRVSALALGVASSTEAHSQGGDIDPRHQSPKEVAHHAELELRGTAVQGSCLQRRSRRGRTRGTT